MNPILWAVLIMVGLFGASWLFWRIADWQRTKPDELDQLLTNIDKDKIVSNLALTVAAQIANTELSYAAEQLISPNKCVHCDSQPNLVVYDLGAHVDEDSRGVVDCDYCDLEATGRDRISAIQAWNDLNPSKEQLIAAARWLMLEKILTAGKITVSDLLVNISQAENNKGGLAIIASALDAAVVADRDDISYTHTLQNLKRMRSGWNGYSGVAPSEQAIEEARRLLMGPALAVIRERAQPYRLDVVPVALGGVAIRCVGPAGVLGRVEILNSGKAVASDDADVWAVPDDAAITFAFHWFQGNKENDRDD